MHISFAIKVTFLMQTFTFFNPLVMYEVLLCQRFSTSLVNNEFQEREKNFSHECH